MELELLNNIRIFEINHKEDKALAITEDCKLIVFDFKQKTHFFLGGNIRFLNSKWLDGNYSLISFTEDKVKKEK